MADDDRSPFRTPGVWVLLRLAEHIFWMLFLAFGVYGLAFLIAMDLSWVMAGWSILFVLPYAMGGLAELAFTSQAKPEAGSGLAAMFTLLLVLVAGGIFLHEGVMCILMLAPLWLLAALLGSASVSYFRKAFAERNRTNAVVLAMLPFAALMVDARLPPQPDPFTVTRSVTIAATPEAIWPYLLQLDALNTNEGIWNVTQDMLGIPRPTSAIVTGHGVGAVRAARWGDDIRFEEHITTWRENAHLGWTFAFPDDSISRYTDPHIHPDGVTLKIATGSYRLTSLAGGLTELRLETDYIARTPFNLYAAMWGELVLGDIQTNILAVVKARVEG